MTFKYGQYSEGKSGPPIPYNKGPLTLEVLTEKMKNSTTSHAKLEPVFPDSGDLTALPIHCAHPLHLHLQETHSPLNEVSFQKGEPCCQPQAELKGSSEQSQ